MGHLWDVMDGCRCTSIVFLPFLCYNCFTYRACTAGGRALALARRNCLVPRAFQRAKLPPLHHAKLRDPIACNAPNAYNFLLLRAGETDITTFLFEPNTSAPAVTLLSFALTLLCLHLLRFISVPWYMCGVRLPLYSAFM